MFILKLMYQSNIVVIWKKNIPNPKAYNKDIQMAFALVFNYVSLGE